jgi:hypothetical protein
MKLFNTVVGVSALALAALSPLAASAMVSADAAFGTTRSVTTTGQQDAKLKLFWEEKSDFCLLIVAVCIEPDEKKG